ncbi:hypothetical protein BP6252_07964 [Coleophoma cylindrospora]|uniref:Non-classical export protein 1 n=1 Tax=Coleophoma cylindrospora TaxID=1849047 RepID=A0A3D8RBZ2_9HELO|nr:hypothetical protein BP6252_07964 [Coleophoma cylindrospora]
MSAAAAPKYLISKVGDPLFALFIGAAAAATRIRREEQEAGHSSTQTMEALNRRLRSSLSWSGTGAVQDGKKL